ncbi:hypothetical protein DFH28DRAFT_1111153 [Melampsora americana]|nr:hypothetical protein DFH28DRAFT_1111153 [Melampsora americana]
MIAHRDLKIHCSRVIKIKEYHSLIQSWYKREDPPHVNQTSFKWITVKELNGQSQITSSGHEVSFDKNNVLHLIKKNRYENTVLLKDKTDETAHSFVIGNGAYWAKKVDPDARILIKEK